MGFTLIEALIAMALLAFGLMGVAAMQLTSLHSAAAGFQHSMASLAAIDAQERAWAQLSRTQSCQHINMSALARDWRAQWFDEPHAPLEKAAGSIERTAQESDCELTVSIVMTMHATDGAEERFDYVFILPALEGA